jgi:thioesterase domain-containing protein
MLVDTLEPSQLRMRVSLLDRIRNVHRTKLSRLLDAPQSVWTYHIRPRIRKLIGVKEIAAHRTALELASDAVDAAYHRAQYAYQTKPLDTDAVVVRATDARMAFLRSGKTLGWKKFVTGSIRVFDVGSDHNRVFEEPAVSQLAVAFKSLLPKDNRN